MRHGSLFSGIGGFDLAAEWMGWENVFSCEINEFGRSILGYYWPDVTHYKDINETDFTIHRGGVDILTGGFPCQPFSLAGKREGTEDDRHLWPRMLEVIREVRPRWVVGENVYGLINWDGGLVFEQVQADLEAEGYEVQPVILPAASVNAPHKRDRVWFIAYSEHGRDSEGSCGLQGEGKGEGVGQQHEVYISGESGDVQGGFTPNYEVERCKRLQHKQREFGSEEQWESGRGGSQDSDKRISSNTKCNLDRGEERGCVGEEGRVQEVYRKGDNSSGESCRADEHDKEGGEPDRYASNPSDKGLQGSEEEGDVKGGGERGVEQPTRQICSGWEEFPTQPPVCSGDDGLSSRLDGITFPKWRNESIKAYGNAVVPRVVYEIFKFIQQIENQ
jgi:DNA (cytosine-5)-methyltransferase 1